jgi:hypothetical protein
MKTLTEKFEEYKVTFQFMYPDENLKGWVNETNFINHYTDQWDDLMEVVKAIAEKTEYELVMSYGYSYWNNGGENPLEEFGGYENISAIYEAVIEFIKWYNNQKN